MAVLSVSSGLSLLEEKIFEARFQTVPELRRIGGIYSAGEAFALIEGKERLLGTDVRAEELQGRSGAYYGSGGCRRKKQDLRHGMMCTGV